MSSMAIPERLVGDDVVADLSPLFERHGLAKKLVMVHDAATWEALGQRIHDTHGGLCDITPHSLGKYVSADMSHMPALFHAAQEADGLLAVGSGTINDITKYVAHELNKPYIAIATAASMNGYTSAGASIAEDGLRHSHLCRPPVAVVAEMPVIISAPRRLARAGLGDTFARATIEPDCLLSHYILGTAYPAEAFAALRAHEQPLLSEAIRLTEGNPGYFRRLLEALLDAGDWMARTGSSAVASQGEHMIAHTAEMMYGIDLRDTFHGEVVGVAAIAMVHLQRKMLLGTINVKPLPREQEKFNRLFGRKLGGRLAPAYATKVLTQEKAEAINQKLGAEWPEMKNAIQRIMRSPITMERAFLQANLPISSKEINLSPDRFDAALSYAYLTRDRFTFLDLAAMMGKRIS